MIAEADAARLESAAPGEVLEWVYSTHARVAVVSSFQAESGVLIDMACGLAPSVDVITLDTGRLPEQTFTVMEQFRERYPISLHVVAPDAGDVQALVSQHGPNCFRRAVELRHECCDIRKVRPLRRALQGYDAWITGLRREQSANRAGVAVVSHDLAHGGITKVAPLATWSRGEVWDYIDAHEVPVHPLYTEGYTSIGCEPCTRATAPGEDERAGRWWWERDAVKECGLHSVSEMLA